MKKGIIYLMVLIFTCSFMFAGCSGDEGTLKESKDSKYKDARTKFESIMKDRSANNNYCGVVLVAKNGSVLFNRGYGMADYSKNTKNTPETVFEIGAITQQFTIAATLMLQGKNLLSIQDTVNKYIHDFPNGDKIKIINLLNNTSGIPEYMDENMPASDSKTYTKQELIELFKNKPLDFEPGTKIESSSSNFILLGYIIEKVSGMKYEDYIKDKIIQPLKLKNTGFINSMNNAKNKAVGYSLIGLGTKNSPPKAQEPEASYLYSAGEMYSTSEDLYLWETALYGGKLIKKDALMEILNTNVKMINSNKFNFGFGFSNSGELTGDKAEYSIAVMPGYSDSIYYNISKKYMIILLSNRQHDSNIEVITMNFTTELEKKN